MTRISRPRESAFNSDLSRRRTLIQYQHSPKFYAIALFTFTSAESVTLAFHDGIAYSAGIVLAMMIGAAIASRTLPSKLNLKWVGILSCIAFALCLAMDYASSYGEFASAEVNESEIKLLYVGPFGGEVILPRESIQTILFGLPGKIGHRCNLRIRQKSGQSHRSGTRLMPSEACKNMRVQIMSILPI